MKNILKATLLVVVFFLIGIICLPSCSYDNEIDLYGSPSCDTVKLSYQAHIVPILRTNCYKCHAVTSSVTNFYMDTYGSLKKYVENGSFSHSLRGTGGYDIMPPNGKMSACDIAKLEAWVKAGYPEN